MFYEKRTLRQWTACTSSVVAMTLLFAGTGMTIEAQTTAESDSAFVIICFPGPPAADSRIEHYRRIRQAHFNLVLPSYRFDDEQQLQMLDHCHASGLRGVVNVKRLAPPLAEGPPPPDWKKRVTSAAERFAQHPALYGYMIRDEPSATVFPQLGRVAREFRRVDPTHDICVNLFSIYASSEQLGVTSYEEYLDNFLSTVKPPALCYDHYPFMRHGEDRRDYFHDLEVARRVCLKRDTPLWIVVLSAWWQHFRTPTDAELRWQAYGALTYGIRGIAYFTYWPVKADYTAVVDYAGVPQPLYDSIQQLNQELVVLGSRLATMRSVGVYHMGHDIPVGCQRLPDDSWFNASGNPPLAVGLFESKDGSRSVFVMNRNCKRAETTTLRFPPNIVALSLTESITGRVQGLKLQGKECRVTIPAGTGLLLSMATKQAESSASLRREVAE